MFFDKRYLDMKFAAISGAVLYGGKEVFLFWLEDYKWFQCSKLFDGPFCLPFVISGHHIRVNSSKVDKLVVGPFIDWSYAVASFKMHIKSNTHQTAL